MTPRSSSSRTYLPQALLGLLCASGLGACAAVAPVAKSPEGPDAAFPTAYAAPSGGPTWIVGATVLTGDGARLDDATVHFADGRIVAVGREVAPPPGARMVDGRGKWVTPGLIDVHSHMGNYPVPNVAAHQDGNEMTSPNTAGVWAEHAVWPQDPSFTTARAGGVTTFQVLPGSANLFGGRSVTLKNVPARTAQEMKFPGAPYGLKMACGENPKRVYGVRNTMPMTRMGNIAAFRTAWIEAQRYLDKQEQAAAGKGEAPQRDLRLETLAGVLQGEILIHNHCYRADEIATMIDLAREFGYHPGTFHHAVEAYKVADLLAEADSCAAMWADWWGFKLEAWDATRENAAIVDAVGACAIVHSDSPFDVQRLNQEAAKIMAAAGRVDLEVSPEHAIRWLTANAARALGIEAHTGTLAPGKMADVVVWNGNPFSVYAQAEQVYIDGALVYDRHDARHQPVTDFELGMTGAGGAR
jgi:imidazolonepropionase-like amidohydrolase